MCKHRRFILHYYKSPKTLKKQVRIIHLSSSIRVVKSSNLTFRGYLASTTLILSIRFSLFIVQVLSRACDDCVAHWWFLWHHHPSFISNKASYVLPLEFQLQNKILYNHERATQFWCLEVKIVVSKSLLSLPYHLSPIPLLAVCAKKFQI